MRLVLVLLSVLALVTAGTLAWSATRSPEEKILARIEAAADGFSRTRLSPCMSALGRAFVEETTGFEREDVKAAIVSAFFREVDPLTREFLLRAEVVDLEVEVEGDGAAVSFTVHLLRRSGDEWSSAWSFRLEGDARNGEDGWQLVRARVHTLEGAIPN